MISIFFLIDNKIPTKKKLTFFHDVASFGAEVAAAQCQQTKICTLPLLLIFHVEIIYIAMIAVRRTFAL